MIRRTLHIIFFVFLLIGISNATFAQGRTRILFLLDASGSMKNSWSDHGGTSKWLSAKKILIELADSLRKDRNVEIGLRVYGHLSPPTERNCNDTRLEVGFSRNSFDFIKIKLDRLIPKGITPISNSLKKAAGDFPSGGGRNIVVLMTDGEESCEGNPCEVARLMEKNGVVLKHFVIGIGKDIPDYSALDCIGTFYKVENQQSLKVVLQNIVSRLVNQTSLQVELLNAAKQPKETDINMSFHSYTHNILKYDFYHTLNNNGIPDTLTLDPVEDYKLIVHTLPPIFKNKLVLQPNQHNVVKLDAEQGWLNIKLQGSLISKELSQKMKCMVKTAGTNEMVNVHEMSTRERYLSGDYNLEILTLPRTYKPIKISENTPVEILIPTPGILELVKQYDVSGGIFIEGKEKLEKIYEISRGNKIEIVALQPGIYFIIYKPRFSKDTHDSRTIKVDIKSGASSPIKL